MKWLQVTTRSYFRLEKRNSPSFAIDGGKDGAYVQNLYLWAASSSNQNQQWQFTNTNSRLANMNIEDEIKAVT